MKGTCASEMLMYIVSQCYILELNDFYMEGNTTKDEHVVFDLVYS